MTIALYSADDDGLGARAMGTDPPTGLRRALRNVPLSKSFNMYGSRLRTSPRRID